MPEISTHTKELITKYALWKNSKKPQTGAATIHVDEVASKVAAFYEQIRTIIDWKEEHLMRRAAIIRKLKRRFFDLELSDFSTRNIAEPLVLELIRGGFFPNDKIETLKIQEVQNVIEKYVFILRHNPENKKGKTGVRFYNQLLEIAACEIEETLDPAIREMALIDFMFAEMRERIFIHEDIYKKGLLKKEDADIQIYIAVQQALFKLDDPIISYNIIRHKYQNWDRATQEELLKISQNIFGILRGIEKDLQHPLGQRFYRICEKYDTPYLLLGDVLAKDNPQKTEQEMQSPPALESMVRAAYTKRLADLKVKIRRAAVYSTISIFITKILSLLILEVILAKLFSGHFDWLALAIDVLIPTILMCLLVAMVKPPSKKNLAIAIMETIKITYEKEKKDVYEIRPKRKKSVLVRSFLSFIYLLGACVSFGAIFWVFNYFQFPISSIIINTIFIALILFAGTAVQTRSRELTMEEETGGFFGFISDILFLPVTGVGRWLSNTWKQYNAITAFLNALIDMPFSTFIEFLEGWRYFIKEKKEEMR